ncbi:MAG: hypothetical protein D9V45_12405 [Chloroflexi bacterium]|nr:MAG: hypothetical protein D9V45_12405 [Chloroflexota bacterium]
MALRLRKLGCSRGPIQSSTRDGYPDGSRAITPKIRLRERLPGLNNPPGQ